MSTSSPPPDPRRAGGLEFGLYCGVRSNMDNVVLAGNFRLTATIFRMNAEIIYESFTQKEESLPRNIRAIPFYYLVSHAIELLLKCALLKRGVSQESLKKYPARHNLSSLLNGLTNLNVPISDSSTSVINLLSEQHRQHNLRYTFLLDDGEPTFTPEPSDLFTVLDELLMAGRISTYGR